MLLNEKAINAIQQADKLVNGKFMWRAKREGYTDYPLSGAQMSKYCLQ